MNWRVETYRQSLNFIILSVICMSFYIGVDAKFSISYMNGSEMITKNYFAAPIRFTANNFDFSENAAVIAFDTNNIAASVNKIVVIQYNKPISPPFWTPVLLLQDAGALGVVIDHPYFRK